MDSGETNSDSVPVLSSGATDDAMNEGEDADIAEEVYRPIMSSVQLFLTCVNVQSFSTGEGLYRI